MMAIDRTLIKSLVTLAIHYMDKILGMEILPPEIYSFDDAEDPEIQFHIAINRYCGCYLLGMYCYDTKTIYIKDNVQLKYFLPILFHELTHAFMHQKYIEMDNDYPMPEMMTKSFKDMVFFADQNEGLCELVMTIMCFSIFDIEVFPSNSKEYWLGWRLLLEAFLYMSKMVVRINAQIDETKKKKIAFDSLINVIRDKNNLYNFVKYVPENGYRKHI